MSSQAAFQRGVDPLLRLLLPGREDDVPSMKVEPALRDRIEELAEKSTEDALSPEERDEYLGYVRANKFVAVLRREARKFKSAGNQHLMPMNHTCRKTLTALMGCLALLATPSPTGACTRVLWNDNALAVLVGRTMDWPESTMPILTVLPRGMVRDGSRLGPELAVKENGLKWTSQYGSLVTTVYALGTADGMNERGLAAHMLYFTACDFGPRDTSKPGIQAGLWAQYLLDNATTVAEALALLDKIQFIMVEAHGAKTTVHLAIEDAGGDSAIIEYISGKPVIHHGREFHIMTNDPRYDEQLELLKAQDFSRPSSTMPLPGNVNPKDRFQRAAYFHAMLPKPGNEREGVASILSIMRNVSVPFGAPYKDFGIYNTEYRTVCDLSNKRYYFELSTSPSIVWADLAKLDFAPGAKVMMLNPDDIDLSGNVTGNFKPSEKAPF